MKRAVRWLLAARKEKQQASATGASASASGSASGSASVSAASESASAAAVPDREASAVLRDLETYRNKKKRDINDLLKEVDMDALNAEECFTVRVAIGDLPAEEFLVSPTELVGNFVKHVTMAGARAAQMGAYLGQLYMRRRWPIGYYASLCSEQPICILSASKTDDRVRGSFLNFVEETKYDEWLLADVKHKWNLLEDIDYMANDHKVLSAFVERQRKQKRAKLEAEIAREIKAAQDEVARAKSVYNERNGDLQELIKRQARLASECSDSGADAAASHKRARTDSSDSE